MFSGPTGVPIGMARMGHDSIAAALVYQHASREADQSIADHLDARLLDRTKDASPVSETAPFALLCMGILGLERVTGIEPAWSAWKLPGPAS